MCDKKSKPSNNNEKIYNRRFKKILRHYLDDDRLFRFIPILEAEYHSSSGKAWLDEIYTNHLIEAWWVDIGGEGE